MVQGNTDKAGAKDCKDVKFIEETEIKCLLGLPHYFSASTPMGFTSLLPDYGIFNTWSLWDAELRQMLLAGTFICSAEVDVLASLQEGLVIYRSNVFANFQRLKRLREMQGYLLTLFNMFLVIQLDKQE
ncbi:hypothetical protein Gotur_016560 [Gossypium turneri]